MLLTSNFKNFHRPQDLYTVLLWLQDIKDEYNIRSNFVAWQSKGDVFSSKYQSIWVILDKLSWKLPQTTTVFTLSYHENNLSEFKLAKFDYTKLFFLEEKVIQIQYERKLKKMFTKLSRWYFFFLFWMIFRIKLITTVNFGSYASAKVTRTIFNINKYNRLH